MVQLSNLYMTTGKTIVLTVWTFVSKVMSLSNALSSFVIAFSHLVLFVVKTPISYLLLRLHLISLSPSSTKVGV